MQTNGRPDSDAVQHLASRLKDLRKASGLSLVDVAEATDLSRSFISMVESGRSDISMGRLLKLVRLYNAPFSDLFPLAQKSAQGAIVTRGGEQALADLDVTGVSVGRLAPLSPTTEMTPVIAELSVGADLHERPNDDGEQFMLVLAGVVQVHLQDEEPFDLRQGDCVYFTSAHPRRLRNTGRRVVRVLRIATATHGTPFDLIAHEPTEE